MIVQITDKRAIIVHDNCYALAKLVTKKDKDKKDYKDWSEHLWPSSMQMAIDKMIQCLISENKDTVTLLEFKEYYTKLANHIKDLLDDSQG